MKGIEWLSFVGDELVVAQSPRELVGFLEAADPFMSAFPAWYVNYAETSLDRYLVRRNADDAWEFINAHGMTTVLQDDDDPVLNMVIDIVSRRSPPHGNGMTREAFVEKHPPEEIPAYTPYGFSLPVRWEAPGQVHYVFDWCPDLVREQIAHLEPAQQLLYVEAMMNRVARWALHIARATGRTFDEIEKELDDHLGEEFPRSLDILTQVHLAVLDQRSQHG